MFMLGIKTKTMPHNSEQSQPQPDISYELQGELFPIEDVQPDAAYRLLVGHHRTNGSFKTDEQLKAEYMTNTDKLVHLMTNGLEVTDPETGNKVVRKPDVVVWLDKSARPLSWLTKEAWPQLAADENGEVPDMPDFKFVNIDREQWINEVDPEGTGYMNIDRVGKSVVRSLRSVFVSPKDKQDGLGQHIDEAQSYLDGKTVMIVDEVYASGRTLDIASKFFKRAFPTAYVGAAHWMGGVTMKGRAIGNADIPVWYREDVATGRGVGNREESKSGLSPSMTQRLGKHFLSTVLKGDQDALQLRKELKMLAKDAAEHKFVFLPSTVRDADDFDQRIERYNDKPIEAVIATKRAQDK